MNPTITRKPHATTKTWRPGEPIPRDIQLDPYDALRRNADFHAAETHQQRDDFRRAA